MKHPIVDQDSLRKYKKEFNFFETPTAVADKMGYFLTGMGRGIRILEPSAGLGALITAAEKYCDFSPKVYFCEIQREFCEALTNYTLVGKDFLTYAPGEIYDAVIMNPLIRTS
ncbi:MAG: hypothetical protein KAS32_30975 [Candidatus Peribacteraceae bacterium]|nr:hypothetical protein [Candidatus Peribacteraceae bacterium]